MTVPLGRAGAAAPILRLGIFRLHRSIAEFVVAELGAAGAVSIPGQPSDKAMEQLISGRATTIYGGTTEVQLNVIDHTVATSDGSGTLHCSFGVKRQTSTSCTMQLSPPTGCHHRCCSVEPAAHDSYGGLPGATPTRRCRSPSASVCGIWHPR